MRSRREASFFTSVQLRQKIADQPAGDRQSLKTNHWQFAAKILPDLQIVEVRASAAARPRQMPCASRRRDAKASYPVRAPTSAAPRHRRRLMVRQISANAWLQTTT